MSTSLTPIQPRRLVPKLMAALAGLEVQTHEQAAANLEVSLPGLTGPQARAALVAEQLAVLGNEVDYAKARFRAELLAELETGDLWRFHPSSPNSLEELVEDKAKLSRSEASDLLAWERYIYPYLERELGLKPFEVWQRLGKTKRRRITPLLRELLDPQHTSRSDKVRAEVAGFRQRERHEQTMLWADRWAETYQEALEHAIPVGPEIAAVAERVLSAQPLSADQEALVRRAFLAENEGYDETRAIVRAVIDMAETRTSRDLENGVSAEHTPTIDMLGSRHPLHIVDGNGEVVEERVTYFIWGELTPDQLDMLRRRCPDRLDLAIQPGELITRRREQ